MKLKNMLKSAVAAWCLAVGAQGLFGGTPLELKGVEKNVSTNFEIVLNAQAAPSEEFAAFELQKYLKMITGLHVPVHNRSNISSECRIMLCLPDSPHFSAQLRKAFAGDLAALKGTDGYAVRQRGKGIYLIADCPKGLLNGVYRFLMKNTDIIWPRPAGELAIFSPAKTLLFRETDYLDIPKFKYRGWGWNHSLTVWSDEIQLWRARMGFNPPGGPVFPMNCTRDRRLGFIDDYFRQYGVGHNMILRWLPVKTYGKVHPEYYMQIDGKRYVRGDANPCYTNPEIPSVIAGRVIDQIGKLKRQPTVVVIQNSDQGLTCECPECLKPLALPDGTTLTKNDEAFRSTQFFLFFNKIAREVGRKYPDVLLQTYGYFFTAIPPKVKLEPNIMVSYCPYIRNDKEPLTGKSNAKWWKRTNGWLKATPNLLLREYYYSGARFPRPLAEIMVQDLRFLQKNGIPYVTSEFTWSDDGHKPAGQPPARMFWDLAAGEVWVMSQLLWDPHQDVTKLRDDFLNRTYREGAPGMREFYRLIREAWLNDLKGSAFNDDIVKSFGYYIIGKKIDKACLAALDKALKAVKNPESKKLIEKAQDTFLFYLKTSKAQDTTELKVPLVKTETFPGFDLNAGPWSKAAVYPVFRQLNNKKPATFPMTLKVFHDGRNLYLGTFVKKTVLKCRPFAVRDASFPSGDHAEFFFVNRKNNCYYHLAWDCEGSVYDALATDHAWNGKWEVRTEKGKDGWRSVMKIPFSEMGFVLQENNKLASTLMMTCVTEKGRPQPAIWGGGQVHSPDSFGDLILDLE